MKSNMEVCHAFCNHKSAKGLHIYTDGRVIYSYGTHFPMAIWKSGRVILNSDKYSVTTSKQQTELRRALSLNNITVLGDLDTSALNRLISGEKVKMPEKIQKQNPEPTLEETIKRYLKKQRI